jgi:hypothetical protein
MHSSAHSTKGTPSPTPQQTQAPTGRKRTVSGALSLPSNGVLFTIPSRYWFPIGRCWYLALDGGPPRFPPDITCPVVLTHAQHAPTACVAYGALTLCSGPFQQPSAAKLRDARGVCCPLPARRPTPPGQRQQAPNTRVVSAPPRSLAATEGIFSSPRGTEMFQFPRCPRTRLPQPVTGYHPRRVAPFGDLWLTGCQRLPRAFRRVAASFLGQQRLGIHPALFVADSPSAQRTASAPGEDQTSPRSPFGDRATRTLIVSCGCASTPAWLPALGNAIAFTLRELVRCKEITANRGEAPRTISPVGAPGLEPGTSALSGPRSHQLSYAPSCSLFPLTISLALKAGAENEA